MKSSTVRNSEEERGKGEGDERPFTFLYHSIFTQSSIFQFSLSDFNSI